MVLGFVLTLVLIPVLWLGSATVYEKAATHTHNFRITLEVDTPEGMKSASSVIEVKFSEKATWVPQSPGVNSYVKGEAVFLDLGSGKNVVCLLGFGKTGFEDRMEYLAADAFGKNRQALWFREAPEWTGKVEIKGELIPTLVTFSNVSDPKSIKPLLKEDFEKKIGPGYSLRHVWLEMTKESPQSQIKQSLPWIGSRDAEHLAEDEMLTFGKVEGSVGYGRKFKRSE